MIFRDGPNLIHYASKYYDPVKAHEYYMRTRELKGRRSTANLDEEGKKAWKYVKPKIMAERKKKLDDIKTSREQRLEQIRTDSKRRQEALTNSIKQRLFSLSNNSGIRKIPKNASAATRLRLQQHNAEQRADNREKRAELQNERAEKREQIKFEVSTTLNNARNDFNKKKTDTVNKYLKILDDEYNRIHAKWGKANTARANNVQPLSDDPAEQRRMREERYQKRQNAPKQSERESAEARQREEDQKQAREAAYRKRNKK